MRCRVIRVLRNRFDDTTTHHLEQVQHRSNLVSDFHKTDRTPVVNKERQTVIIRGTMLRTAAFQAHRALQVGMLWQLCCPVVQTNHFFNETW
jgi:hypothetical protein